MAAKALMVLKSSFNILTSNSIITIITIIQQLYLNTLNTKIFFPRLNVCDTLRNVGAVKIARDGISAVLLWAAVNHKEFLSEMSLHF